eukprot:9865063-Alexandrium_andersonii.AAC.1
MSTCCRQEHLREAESEKITAKSFYDELRQDPDLGPCLQKAYGAPKRKKGPTHGSQLPPQLTLSSLRACLPKVAACFPFHEVGANRL